MIILHNLNLNLQEHHYFSLPKSAQVKIKNQIKRSPTKLFICVYQARYKLLKDWVDNDDDGTLGRLASILWEEGERQIVRELSIIYKETKK